MKTELLTQLKSLLENEDAPAIKAEVDAIEKSFRQEIAKEKAAAAAEADSETAEADESADASADASAESTANAEATAEADEAAGTNAEPGPAPTAAEDATDADAEEEDGEASEEPAAEEAAEASEPADPIAEEFFGLVGEYREKLRAIDRAKREEMELNYQAKRAMVDELEKLIEEEENIGRMFQVFRDLQEKWKALGAVPPRKHADLQRDYSKQIENFYYNVRIYKELKEHDLKKNLELKQGVIDKMKLLAKESSVRKAEEAARKLLEEWDEIGPTHQDDWEKVREEFREAANVVFGRVRDHFQGLRDQQKANLEAKEALCAKAEEVLENLPRSHKKWMQRTEEVMALQKEWKSIGFASKKANEKVWERFRAACNKFFDLKSDFYTEKRGEHDDAKRQKEALIEQALKLKDSTDWKQTTGTLVKLQKAWKQIGPASQRDEQRLWKQFREACDHFFNAKKGHFEGMDDRQTDNLKAKEAIIAEVEQAKPKGRDAIFNAINEFQERWQAIGHVPFKQKDRIANAYSKAIDNLYDLLDVDRKEVDVLKFENRLASMVDSDNAEFLLGKEKRFIRERIEQLQSTITQYENNLGFFAFAKGAEADKMKADVESKIASNKAEIKNWKEKRKMVDLAMRKANEPEQQEEAVEETNSDSAE